MDRLRARGRSDGEIELDAGDDHDRIALAVAERAGVVTLAPSAGGRMRVEVFGARPRPHPRGPDVPRGD